MKKPEYKKNVGIIIFSIILLIVACLFDFRAFVESCSCLLTLKQNVLYFTNIITKAAPLIIILLIIIVWRKFATKWVIKVEKLNVGGASIIFERPEELFKQQIKNFMNTKRTLFYFDPERDNISDTISSFYKTYEFIREIIKVYDTKSSQESEYYNNANDMIHTLNEFLTSHQSNYRRWFDNRIENSSSDDFLRHISEIQKEYWNYDALVEGFKDLNSEFLKYAEIFDINTDKWTKV